MVTSFTDYVVSKSSFEKIEAWQRSQQLAKSVYIKFRDLKDFSFKDQICRAVVSISNNIAEGRDRGTDKEFVRFLYYSKGSCAEVRSLLYLAKELEYINSEDFRAMHSDSMEISRMIMGFIKALKRDIKG
ncbi:MAG: four helix bundle protein [Sphingobacteriales bacterium]|jgi:four helix bundle protein